MELQDRVRERWPGVKQHKANINAKPKGVRLPFRRQEEEAGPRVRNKVSNIYGALTI